MKQTLQINIAFICHVESVDEVDELVQLYTDICPELKKQVNAEDCWVDWIELE